MSLRKIADQAVKEARTERKGSICSPLYQLRDVNGNWIWGCDVYLGADKVLNNVPIAANNRDVIYSQQGKGVSISRLSRSRFAVDGLSKVVTESTHYTYVSFEEDVYTIISQRLVGFDIRPLTYGELGDLASPAGYGVLPYGCQGRFDLDGNLLEIMEWD